MERMVNLQKHLWLVVFFSRPTASTEHSLSLYPSTGDPRQSISHDGAHHYTNTNTGNVLTPYMEMTWRLSSIEIYTSLTGVGTHYMTPAIYPTPTSTSNSFEPSMSSAINNTSLEPETAFRLTCYSCRSTGCGQERQHYDPLRQCGTGELCYFEMINDGMMSAYTRGCVRVGDVTCQNARDRFSCQQSRRENVCRLCCRYDKCNSMAWTSPNNSTALTSGITTVIACIIITLL